MCFEHVPLLAASSNVVTVSPDTVALSIGEIVVVESEVAKVLIDGAFSTSGSSASF